MILGVGVDLTPIVRMSRALDNHPDRLEARLFTDGERAYCRARTFYAQHFAARFAAKEATLKALGVPHGLSWHELEVLSLVDAPPQMSLSGNALLRATEKGVTRLHLSLTHAGDSALAFVIAEG